MGLGNLMSTIKTLGGSVVYTERMVDGNTLTEPSDGQGENVRCS